MGKDKRMKVLFIGHYKEGSGWANAATNYILAMDAAGIDVVCRSVRLTYDTDPVPDRILELEKKSSSGCDICIQNLLPHHLVGSKQFKKNIAIFFSESFGIKVTPWFTQLQQMDEVWVPNSDLKTSLIEDGLEETGTSVKVVPCPSSLKKYKAKYRDMTIKGIDDKFTFYYIGDFNERKNIISMVKAFHSEFDRSEPVSLLLKVRKFGVEPSELSTHVHTLCGTIKGRMRLYQDINDYHKEIVIPEHLDANEINALHKYGDCFITVSHGEAWSIPAFDAMCFGNTPICSNVGGPKDFIDQSNSSTGSLIDGVGAICDQTDSAFPELFSGRESWFTPNELQVKEKMRYYYENRESIDRGEGLRRGEKFSYEKVGDQIKEYLGG